MSEILIITEKPSVAQAFKQALKVQTKSKTDGFIEGYSDFFKSDICITWAVGHLVRLSYPEAYNPDLKKWTLETLPFVPQTYKYEIITEVKKQFNIVKKLMKEVTGTIYNAGDSAREGEYIQRLILQEAKPTTTNIKRIWTDSQTEEELLRAIRDAKPSTDYDKLAAAAYERAIEDFLSGINLSRAYTLKFGNILKNAADLGFNDKCPIAIGRVMTCVLGLVVEKEKQVRNYVPSFSYGIKADANNFTAEWKAVENTTYFNDPRLAKEDAFNNKIDADNLISQLQNHPLVVQEINSKTENKQAPLLFNLAELQAECTKVFKISPQETLDCMQVLYEKKMTTYPRTSARVLSTAVAKEITTNINGLSSITEVSNFVSTIVSNQWYKNLETTKYVDDSKISDHYAIIPTGNVSEFNSLSQRQKEVYLLVVKRFLSIFYPAASYKKISATFDVNGEKFFTNASTIENYGYLEIVGNEEKDEKKEVVNTLLTLQKGQQINATYGISEKQTQKPKRYTSGSMVLAMENAGKLIEDPELRAQIKNSGLGTDATRSAVIEKLIANKYINLDKKTQILSPTMIGEMIAEIVLMITPTLLSPEFTASWEKGLSQIEDGNVSATTYRDKLTAYVSNETNTIKNYTNLQLVKDKLNEVRKNYGKDAKEINNSSTSSSQDLALKCPCCNKPIKTVPWGFACTDYKNGCSFTVGEICGTKVSEKQLTKVLTTGKSDLMQFKSKAGNNFAAQLVVEEKDGTKRIGLSFAK